MEFIDLEKCIHEPAFEETLVRLYGEDHAENARARCAEVLAGFVKTFESQPEALFSAPGRTEVGGNHTDHQHGRVLAAAVDLDILAAAAPNQSGMIRVQSQGYPLIVVDLGELTPKAEEENTSAALIRRGRPDGRHGLPPSERGPGRVHDFYCPRRQRPQLLRRL